MMMTLFNLISYNKFFISQENSVQCVCNYFSIAFFLNRFILSGAWCLAQVESAVRASESILAHSTNSTIIS